MVNNLLIIGIILYVLLVTLYFLFKKEDGQEEEDVASLYSIDYLVSGIKEKMNELTDTSIIDRNLSKSAAKKEEARKLQLLKALRTCCYGDANAKLFVKDYIKKILLRDFHVNETTINHILPFEETAKLAAMDKFDILLYLYKMQFQYDGLAKLIIENNFHQLKGSGEREDHFRYEITAEEIENLFDRTYRSLNYLDKLEIITQKVYSHYMGNGVIDEIRDMGKLDGISAGLSGLTNEYYHYIEEYMVEKSEEIDYYYNSIWIMFQGKTIHLSFMGFGSKAEMVRVAKKMYRYDDPGYLSEEKGYIINSMADGSRIVVVRPKIAENWAFFIRKLNSIEDISIENLITDPGAELPIQVMKWLVKGCRVIAVTGKQFSGKTTLIKGLVEFINPQFNIRVQEMIFELYLKRIKRYRHRDILTMKDSASVSEQDIVNLFKKTDGDVYILGEVATPTASSLAIQNSLSGARQLLLSHHAKTAEALVDSFKFSLLQTKVFTSELAAEEQVARALHFDFHMNTTIDGHIYLERITEIIPVKHEDYPENVRDCFKEFFRRMTNEKRFCTKDIVRFLDGRYQIVGSPSVQTREALKEYLTHEEMCTYHEFFQEFREEIA